MEMKNLVEDGALDLTNYILLQKKWNLELVRNVELAIDVYSTNLDLLKESFKYLAKKYNVELDCVNEIAEAAKDVVLQKNRVLYKKE